MIIQLAIQMKNEVKVWREELVKLHLLQLPLKP